MISRRHFFQGIIVTAAGLVIPNPDRQVWALDRSMLPSRSRGIYYDNYTDQDMFPITTYLVALNGNSLSHALSDPAMDVVMQPGAYISFISRPNRELAAQRRADGENVVEVMIQ